MSSEISRSAAFVRTARSQFPLPPARASRLAATALLALSLLALSSCAKPGSGTGDKSPGAKEPVTLTFFTVDVTEDMPFTDPVARAITEKTGVTLEVDHPVAGDQQAIPLMIASGQFPDLIYAKGDLTLLIEAGAILPLDDLIARKGENLRKLYGDQLPRLRNSTDDPAIYTVGTYGVRTGIWKTDGTMQLQHAVLRELGYPRIQTFDDYEGAIRAYLAKYPTIDGLPTIGLSLLIDSWQWYIDLSNPAGFAIGLPDDGQWVIDEETLEARYKFLRPDIRLYFQWLNGLNAEGLLDPESFTQKEDVWKSKVASGRVLGIAHPIWGYADARASLIKDGKAERTYAYLPVTANRSYRAPSLKDYGFSGGWGIAISKTCKDPERAFEFLDWMCSEEAQILVNWGIENVNYVIKDGRRVVPDSEQARVDTDPDYAQKTGVGRWSYPFPQFGSAWVDSTGNYVTRESPERIAATYLDEERETLDAWGAKLWTDLFPSTESLGISRWGQAWQYSLPSELNTRVIEADDYMKGALAKAILGNPEDFDEAWSKIVRDLEAMGIAETNAAMTRIVRDKVALWSGRQGEKP